MTYMVDQHEPLHIVPPEPSPALTAEQQLQEAYRIVGELQLVEARLRVALDTALATIRGESR